MKLRIIESYRKTLSYTRTAKELDIDERAVSNVVDEDRKTRLGGVKDAKAVASTNAGLVSDSISGGDTRRDMKAIYEELQKSRVPSQIVASTGLDPELVEKEFQRFNRQRECNPIALQQTILNNWSITDDSRGFLDNQELFRKKGYLTNSETIELIDQYCKMRSQLPVKRIFGRDDHNPPKGWFKIRCATCDTSFAIIRSSDELATQCAARMQGLWHATCGPPGSVISGRYEGYKPNYSY